jgi:hypothetical protein
MRKGTAGFRPIDVAEPNPVHFEIGPRKCRHLAGEGQSWQLFAGDHNSIQLAREAGEHVGPTSKYCGKDIRRHGLQRMDDTDIVVGLFRGAIEHNKHQEVFALARIFEVKEMALRREHQVAFARL